MLRPSQLLPLLLVACALPLHASPITLFSGSTLVQAGSTLAFDIDLATGLAPGQVLAGANVQVLAQDDQENQAVGTQHMIGGYHDVQYSYQVPYTYSCGFFSTCTGYTTYYYTVSEPFYIDVPLYAMLPDPGGEGLRLGIDGALLDLPVTGAPVQTAVSPDAWADGHLHLTVDATVGDFLLNSLIVDVIGMDAPPSDDVTGPVAAVPEPSTLAQVALGSMILLAAIRRRRRA